MSRSTIALTRRLYFNLTRQHGTAQASAQLSLLAVVGIIVWLLAAAYGGAKAADAASSCSPLVFEGSHYFICTLDLRAYELRLFWKDENGQPYGSFDHLPRRLNGAPIVFAMNAGMSRLTYLRSASISRTARRSSGQIPPKDPATFIFSRMAFFMSVANRPACSLRSVFFPCGRGQILQPSLDLCSTSMAEFIQEFFPAARQKNPQWSRYSQRSHGGSRYLIRLSYFLAIRAPFPRRTRHRRRSFSGWQHFKPLCAGAQSV